MPGWMGVCSDRRSEVGLLHCCSDIKSYSCADLFPKHCCSYHKSYSGANLVAHRGTNRKPHQRSCYR